MIPSGSLAKTAPILYAYQEPGPKALWVDVSRYQPHPDAEYDRIEEEKEECEEDFGFEQMDADEDGQEYSAGSVEEYVREGDYVGEKYIPEGV